MTSRTRFLAPALALSFAACVHKVVYLPAPGESPAAPPVQQPVQSAPEPVWQPAPVPAPSIEPLEVTIGRPVRDRFILQTSRPAYVAIFEVVPGQGVTMMRPASVHETYVVSGIGSVRAWWTTPAAQGRAQDGAPSRYIYAIASDEPLRITEASFQPGYLRRALGNRLHGAADPFATMRALSRHFVPSVVDEAWGEDAFVVPATPGAPPRVVRVYCPDGSRHEVSADMADRVRCGRGKQQPGRRVGHGRSDGPVSPDSIVGDDNRHVRPRVPTRVGHGPIDRVSVPTVPTATGPREKGGVPVAHVPEGGRTPKADDRSRGAANGHANGHANGNAGSNGNGRNAGHNGNVGNKANDGSNGNNGNNGDNGRKLGHTDSVPSARGRAETDTARVEPARPAVASTPRGTSPRVMRPGRVRPTLPNRDTSVTMPATTESSSAKSDKAEKLERSEKVAPPVSPAPSENTPVPAAADDKDKGAKAEKAEKPEAGEKPDSAAKKPRPELKPLKRPF